MVVRCGQVPRGLPWMPGEAPSGLWSSPCIPHLVMNRPSLGQEATLSAGAACTLTPSHPSSDQSCCPSSTLSIQPPRPWSRTEELAQYGRGGALPVVCPHHPSDSQPCSGLPLGLSSVQLTELSNSFRPHEPQHARPPCPSPTPRAYPNSCPLSR